VTDSFNSKAPPHTDRRQDRSDERALWEVAARITSGLLSNDAKAHYTVKDSLALFDEVLHDLVEYARVRGTFGLPAARTPDGDPNVLRHADVEERAVRPIMKKVAPLPTSSPQNVSPHVPPATYPPAGQQFPAPTPEQAPYDPRQAPGGFPPQD
jgi:hypothetical protein